MFGLRTDNVVDLAQTAAILVSLWYVRRAFTEGAKLLRDSLARIDALERRIAELESAERLERRVTAFAEPATIDSQ